MSYMRTPVDVAFDSRSLDSLKVIAKKDQASGLQAAAKQLEGVFIQMMLKSMRDAAPKEGLFSSEQSDMFTSMLDQQLSQQIAGNGGLGFADMMMKSLGAGASTTGQTHVNQGLVSGAGWHHQPAVQPPDHRPLLTAPFYPLREEPEADEPRQPTGPIRDNASFISQLSVPAMKASQKSGIPHQLIIAQAALESGWGHREIPAQDGKSSFNLFGIKATPDWQGEKTEITTTEYVHGVAKKVKAAFRVYQSYAEALSDYAVLLSRNPRYHKVTQAGTPEMAAHALQSGGYATDPNYAEKLIDIMKQVKVSIQHSVAAYKTDLSELF